MKDSNPINYHSARSINPFKKNHELEIAIEELTKIINQLKKSRPEKNNICADTYYNIRGEGYMKQGEVVFALGDFIAARNINPNNPDFHHNIGLALTKLGEFESANEAFEKAAKLQSNNSKIPNKRNRLTTMFIIRDNTVIYPNRFQPILLSIKEIIEGKDPFSKTDFQTLRPIQSTTNITGKKRKRECSFEFSFFPSANDNDQENSQPTKKQKTIKTDSILDIQANKFNSETQSKDNQSTQNVAIHLAF